VRWPTLWHRRAAPGDAVVDRDTSGGPSARVADGPHDGDPPERSSTAWRDLAPIERTVQDHPLTASTGAFVAGLAGPRMPDPILQPLGHDATADGPSGLVSGLAVPLATSSAGSRSVQGTPSALGPPGRAGLAARGSSLAFPRRSPSGHMGSAGAPGPEDVGEPAATTGTADVPSAHVRNLAAVPDAARVAPRAYTLAAAASLGDLPFAARGGLDAAAEPSTREIQVGAPRPIPGFEAPQPSVGDQRSGMAGLQPALRRTAEGATETAGHGPDQPAGDDRAIGTRGTAERPTLGQVRKMGLGAPLASHPDRMVRPPQPTSGRSGDTAPGPSVGVRPAEPGAVGAARSRRAGGSADPVTGGAPQPMQALPLATQRTTGAARSDAVLAASPRPPSGPMGGRSPSAAASEPVASGSDDSSAGSEARPGGMGPHAAPPAASLPLVGDRGIGPSPTQQAGAERPIERTVGDHGDHPGARAWGVAARRDPDDVRPSPPRPATSVAGQAKRSSTDVGAAASGTPADSASRVGPHAGSVTAWPGAVAPVASTPLRPRPVQRSTHGQEPESSLAWTPGLGIRPVPADASPGSSATPLQRSVNFEEVTAEVAPASSDTSRGPGQAASPGAVPDAFSDQQLDMLARRIYGRIRDRLGSELLLDRERAGSLADL